MHTIALVDTMKDGTYALNGIILTVQVYWQIFVYQCCNNES